LQHQEFEAPVSDSVTQIVEKGLSAGIAQDGHRVRADIEGLRALAVLSVLINHAFPGVLPGGFAGVDIFFVISGYLIGRHLLQDIQSGRFSILSFYAKRARRIFPALALVLVSTWIVGWLVFSAPEFAALGKHIATSAIFSNNILLWSEAGYFDVAAIDKPLLHLWSLGIEEQFYLLVPAMLWLGTKGTTGSIRWVARLGALSLLATIVLGNFDYSASFYLLHSRFWELAAGVALAQVELRTLAYENQHDNIQSASKRDIREILLFLFAIVFAAVLVLGAGGTLPERDAILRSGGLGLAIAAAAAAALLADRCARGEGLHQLRSWWIQHGTQFAAASSIAGATLTCGSLITLSAINWPGAQTLFPVVGAMLWIAATPLAPSNRLLAWGPLAFIGGISYPLYLWHWPAMVIYRLLSPQARGIELLTPLTASFLLAWITKTLLEDPIRFGRLGLIVFRRPSLRLVVSSLGFGGLLGLWVLVAHGLPSRFPPGLRAVAEWSEINPDINWRIGHCYFYLNSAENFSRECTPEKQPGVPLILLWGDSHAAHLYPGIADLRSKAVFDIAQWTSAGCPPTVNPLLGESGDCPKRRATAMSKLAQLNPDTIVLGGAWERYLEWGESPERIVGELTETIRLLRVRGIRRIVVIGPGHLWNTSLPVDLFRFMARSRSSEIPARLGTVSDSLWHLDAAMAAQAVAERVQYVSVLNYFCDNAGCLTVGDRTLPRPDLLYRDQDHLTVTGSKVLIAHSRTQLLGED
jgi:peptidoglycan/LPS O-acetylase OafA/YrhL